MSRHLLTSMLCSLVRLAKARAGNVATISALAAPGVIGALGLGVETGLWYWQDSRLQQAADVASYAGASEMIGGASHSTVRATATAEAQRNGWDPDTGTIDVNIPPSSGAYQNNNSVEVLLTSDRPRLFSALFSSDPVHMNARGVSTIRSLGTACMLALSPTASRAANFSGNGQVTLNGCSVISNSSADDAVRVWGSALVTTECVYAVGNVTADDGLILTECDEPQEQSSPSADPFANTPFAATPAGACQNAPADPSPGVRYCSMSLSGTRTLPAGDYFIDGGTFRINANAHISGTGVTFHLLNGATADFNGSAEINFSAPTAGARKGMLFMSNSTSGVNRFNGTANSHLTGALYFPENEVQFNGNFSGASGCMQIVAELIDYTGSSTFSTDCTAQGLNAIPATRYARLVE